MKENYPQAQASFAKGNLLLEEDFYKIYFQGNAFQVQKKFTFVTSFVLGRYMASRSELRSAFCIQWLTGSSWSPEEKMLDLQSFVRKFIDESKVEETLMKSMEYTSPKAGWTTPE